MSPYTMSLDSHEQQQRDIPEGVPVEGAFLGARFKADRLVMLTSTATPRGGAVPVTPGNGDDPA